MRFSNRHILVTGGASGIGAAVCRALAAGGARVAVLDRNAVEAHAVAAEIGGLAVEVDVADEHSVQAAVTHAAAAFGALDGVVNAAGISVFKPLEETDLALWENALGINLRGPFLICRAAATHLRKNAGSTIVNVSSAVALHPLVNRSAYAASKGGLVSMTKVLAMELAPTIRCNVVCPGAIDTPMVRSTFDDPAALARVTARYALQRLGESDEAAAAILFLTSAESSFVTGSTLVVDGGRTYY